LIEFVDPLRVHATMSAGAAGSTLAIPFSAKSIDLLAGGTLEVRT